MSQRTNPTLIGIFVLGALVLSIAAVVIVGGGKLFEKHTDCVLYFEGSANGLRKGAPVKFKGVEIGTVMSVSLPAVHDNDDPPIEVVIQLDTERIDPMSAPETRAQHAFDRGLRAQLEADSFVTGVLFVAFVFAPETPIKLRGLRTDLTEVPTIPTQMERLQDAANRIIAQLERIDLASVVRDLGAVASTLRNVVESEGMKTMLADLQVLAREWSQAMTGLDAKLQTVTDSVRTVSERVDSTGARIEQSMNDAQQTLVSARKLIEDVDARGVPLLDSLRESAENLTRITLALESGVAKASGMLDPDAPLAVQLHDALVELQGAARATRVLIELLERNPAALVRGKTTGGD